MFTAKPLNNSVNTSMARTRSLTDKVPLVAAWANGAEPSLLATGIQRVRDQASSGCGASSTSVKSEARAAGSLFSCPCVFADAPSALFFPMYSM